MKKFSDYTGEDAIDLWMDIMDPMVDIISDKKVRSSIQAKKPYLAVAKDTIKLHKKSVMDIITRIDDTPITGTNILTRVLENILDIVNDKDAASFFKSQGLMAEKTLSGSATENTEEAEDQ